jgi:short-subunit dehydrogenase
MSSNETNGALAMVTGASAGIGYELAICCAKEGLDLLVVADEPKIHEAAEQFRNYGVEVESIEADLATREGVDKFYEAARGRAVEYLLANAGHGLGGAFLDQDFDEARHVIDTNITGTIYLITGSVAGYTPGAFSAVYNGTKAFIDSFSFALRSELEETEVTVTCLMPGATETEFFERAGMTDTKVGQGKKDDPVDVAKVGFEAMMRGDGDVVSGFKNKVMTTVASVTPAGMLADQHKKKAQPGSGKE